jgi:hypothetical protein
MSDRRLLLVAGIVRLFGRQLKPGNAVTQSTLRKSAGIKCRAVPWGAVHLSNNLASPSLHSGDLHRGLCSNASSSYVFVLALRGANARGRCP